MVDQNDIKITLLGIEADEEGAYVEVDLKLENNSDKNVGFEITSMLNGFVMDKGPLMNSTISPGTEEETETYLFVHYLAEAGIAYVGELEFIFCVYQTEDDICYFDEDEFCFKTEPVSVKTTHYEKMDSEPRMMEDAEELFNQDGVRVWGKYSDTSYDGTYEPGILLYVQNESEADMDVHAKNLVINGHEFSYVNTYGMGDPLAGKKWIGKVEFDEGDMEYAGITTVEDVQLSLSVNNKLNGEYYYTDNFTIKVK